MSGKLAPLFCLLAFALLHTQYAAADQPPAGEVEQFVVLRNGEVLSGQIRRQADRYIVVANGTEMRVPARDVDFVCKSLDEAYQVQRNRVIAGSDRRSFEPGRLVPATKTIGLRRWRDRQSDGNRSAKFAFDRPRSPAQA